MEKLLITKNKYRVEQLKIELDEESILFMELQGILKQYKLELKLNLGDKETQIQYQFSKSKKEELIKKLTKYLIKQSGIQADYLTDSEKLVQIKKSGEVERVKVLLELVKYPLFHLNKELLSYHIKENIYTYVYHPKAIETANNIFKAIKLLEQIGFKYYEIRNIFSDYGMTVARSELSNTAIEIRAGITIYDELHSQSVKYGVTPKPKVKKRVPMDYSPAGFKERTGIDVSGRKKSKDLNYGL